MSFFSVKSTPNYCVQLDILSLDFLQCYFTKYHYNHPRRCFVMTLQEDAINEDSSCVNQKEFISISFLVTHNKTKILLM